MLFGRDAEMTDVESRTRTSRLVTIVGPGGAGKTTLSRAAAARLSASYPLGARLVDLTRVDQPGAVADAMAAQLGFDSFDALLSSPNDRPALLIVDNCEHLLDATADAPHAGARRVPTTDRDCDKPVTPGCARRIDRLPRTPCPARRRAGPSTCPSVQLFLQRTRDAGAELAGEDLNVVAELCRRLDGLPLAIEIAAAVPG